jgi:histidyl-tRNA synthetase
MTAFFRILDKLDKAGPDAVLHELVESRTVAPGHADTIKKLITEKAPCGGNGLSLMADIVSGVDGAADAIDELGKIHTVLASQGIEESCYTFDITLARGLDYYTGPVFETVMDGSGMGSISGGGRYDDLIGLFSKKSLPATGISFGLERIIGIMEQQQNDAGTGCGTKVLIALFSDDLMGQCQRVAKKLREEHIPAEVYYSSDKLKKQLSYASGRNIPYVLILGPDELEQGNVTVKHMKSGDQRSVPLPDISSSLFSGT